MRQRMGTAAGFFADVFDDQPGEPHPVLEAAAKFIGPVIGALGEKGAHQIAVGAVNLCHVDAGLLRPPGRVAVALDDLVELFPGDGFRDLPPAGGGNRAGGFQRISGESGIAFWAACCSWMETFAPYL